MDNNRTFYSHAAELRSNRKNTALVAFALGIGAAVALLLAPNSGEKTREDLTNSIEQGVNKGQDLAGPALKRLEKELAELRQKFEEKVEAAHKA